MAKGKETAEVKSAGDGAQKPQKTKMLILVVVAVLVLGGGAGGAWLLLGGSKKGGDNHEKAKEESVKPVYVSLERKTYNLSSQDGVDHFLMLAVDVRVNDEKLSGKIKSVMPDILNGMLMLVSSKNVEELSSLEGKKKFSSEIVKIVNEPLHLHEGEKGASDALFTEFVIQ
ncbi:MAG: flagellar basal body-associated FliL family protein [Sulfuricella sp.]|nr:flagellar basal body-associated FliL family protein [Sulfuricella sp.]